LTIKYRTNITGTTQQESLPFRVLVLGDFEGQAKREASMLPDLAKRPVRSIKRGTTVDHHLSEVVPVWKIPEPLKALRSWIPGTVTCERLECTIPLSSVINKKGAEFPVTGTGRFESTPEDNGFAAITGEVALKGALKVQFDDKPSPKAESGYINVSGMVFGDYVDPATQKKVGVITGLVSPRIVLAATDVEKLDSLAEQQADGESRGKVFSVLLKSKLSVTAERVIPFTALKDFSPDAVVSSIPQLHRLRVLKLLLSGLHSELRNRPELRKQVKAQLPSQVEGFKKLREWAQDEFPLLKLDAQ
jgi:predicted component of type VI protein secretion system